MERWLHDPNTDDSERPVSFQRAKRTSEQLGCQRRKRTEPEWRFPELQLARRQRTGLRSASSKRRCRERLVDNRMIAVADQPQREGAAPTAAVHLQQFGGDTNETAAAACHTAPGGLLSRMARIQTALGMEVDSQLGVLPLLRAANALLDFPNEGSLQSQVSAIEAALGLQ